MNPDCYEKLTPDKDEKSESQVKKAVSRWGAPRAETQNDEFMHARVGPSTGPATVDIKEEQKEYPVAADAAAGAHDRPSRSRLIK